LYVLFIRARTNGRRRQLSLAQAREQLPAVVRDAACHGPVELTDEGEPVAVLVAVDEYLRLAGGPSNTWDASRRAVGARDGLMGVHRPERARADTANRNHEDLALRLFETL
jgi:prevent-host-death family protein